MVNEESVIARKEGDVCPPEDLEDEPIPEMNEALRSWDRRRMRLYLLRDLPCPLCRRAGRRPVPDLAWTGVSLACPHGHGWSNPDALHADLRP